MPKKIMVFDLRQPQQFQQSHAQLYRTALEMCTWADARGFDRVSLGEHHQSPDGYIPAPLLFASAIGACTEHLRVRLSILLAPLYNPIRLAEEIAVADLCLGGRLDVGLGVGYVKDDFDAFGVDYSSRGRALDDLIPLLRKAWSGEPFEYLGTMVRVSPRPAQDPMPIFLGGSSARGVERAATLGDGYFPPGMPAGWKRYRARCIELGRPDPGEYPRRGPIFLWVTNESKAEAWEWLAPHIRHQINSYASWTETAYGEPQGPFVPERDIESLRQGGAYEVMTPSEAIDLANALGPDGELIINPLLAGLDVDRAWEMLELLEREVLPSIG